MRTIVPWMLAALSLAACSDDGNPKEESNIGGNAGASSSSRANGGNQATGGSSSGGRPNISGAGGATSIAVGGFPLGGNRAQGGSNPGVAGMASATGGDLGMGGAATAGGIAGATLSKGGMQANAGAGGIGTSGEAGVANAAGKSTSSAGTAGESGNAGMAGVPNSNGIAGMAGGTSAAGAAGTAGTTPPDVPNSGCGVLRESVVGWWSLDGTLANYDPNGKSLVGGPDTVVPNYVAGIASGKALDVGSGTFAEVTDAAFNVTDTLTLSAFIRSTVPDGRIIDRITAGGTDGYLLDFYNGRLRMIVGDRTANSTPLTIPSSQYVHVAGVFSTGNNPEIRLYVDGIPVAVTPVAAGNIPSNGLALRIGADSNGGNLFAGQIDEPLVFSRALSREEIISLKDQLANGTCPLNVVTCPAKGLLLEHSESNIAISGSVDCIRANIRNAGDLRVLHDGGLYSCDWNGMTAKDVSSCQAWVPFATAEVTGGNTVPTVPLEWRLFKFNTTGYTDNLATTIEAYSPSFPERRHFPLAWYGRDWRVKRLSVDSAGNPTMGTLQILADAVRSGAGMGAFIDGWNYALPHFTAVVPLANDQFAGQDPWHMSSDSAGLPGEVGFQSHAYHYAVWFDSSGYNYASRWDFGSANSGSDSAGSDPITFVTEPGWSEVLAHDATGTASVGTLLGLKDAIQNGAPLRVATPEGYFDCNRVIVGTDVGCITYDAYSPADIGNNHLGFDPSHPRMLRMYTTAGRALKENWVDHTATLASASDDQAALRWFAQTKDWKLTLMTNALGTISFGSVDDVVSAIQGGADVLVSRIGSTTERVRCESLRIAGSPTRAACLSLVQVPRALAGGGTNPGYYEARVYNTSGTVATAHVAFGSTDNSALSSNIESLAWYVRRN